MLIQSEYISITSLKKERLNNLLKLINSPPTNAPKKIIPTNLPTQTKNYHKLLIISKQDRRRPSSGARAISEIPLWKS
ncbi:hypothetical protein PHAVU_004G176800 [Phaseolus vulgaris]|uniref:Uncharacterized protein n=1 Tax=Phaseolus vulgaris TaxID=3885 RepID=V7C4B1_PHAVU|nr:hypothetical protein PHAVU_004G176800g [Phaseolus vulgaris]ESW24979.1 hypothetical protein PHAVU_004G176800g [Phaseolus vulgaris]